MNGSIQSSTTTQRSVQATSSRKRWRLTKRLTPVGLEALPDFYDVRRGPTEPFYFYDPSETSPRFSYDPSDLAATGRYTVRFSGEWGQTVSLARGDMNIHLIELA
jgi:hypothetical protein